MKFEDKKISHYKNGDIEYIKFKILEKYDNKLNHAIFLRHGGASKDLYTSLNFRILGKDVKESVYENVNRVKKVLNIPNVYKATQAHTDEILILKNSNKDEYPFDKLNDDEYDAYLHVDKNIPSLITTADCNPIIIYDPVKNIVSNIHSGWLGTIKKIAIKTAIKMHIEFKCEYKDLIVCVGPSIKKCCFSSEEAKFKNKFINIWNDDVSYITYDKLNKDKFYIDLGFVIKKDFIKLGVLEENIVMSDICTRCNKDDFYSYRYYTQNGFEDYATFATIVNLK